jgi:hypothetical protein
MLQSVDVSWPQGNYTPDAGESGCIIAATSGDGGKLFTQNTFGPDIANARAAGKPAGFYHFNGPQDANASADYFWGVIKPFYRPGDVLGLDIESGSGFPAQSPAWAAAFMNRLAANIGVTTQQLRLLIYGNRSDMRAAGWGALEAAGALLWLAAPGGYPENTPVGEWSHWTVLQYSTAGGIDRDESELSFDQIAGAGLPAQPKEDIMHFSQPYYTILWPNGYFSGYDPMVWTAIKYWYDNGTEQPGTEGTVVREIQTAVDSIAARNALIEAATIAQNLNPAKIAAAVVAALPATPTSAGNVDNAAIAAAVQKALQAQLDALPTKTTAAIGAKFTTP